jgi:hypothetical protein
MTTGRINQVTTMQRSLHVIHCKQYIVTNADPHDIKNVLGVSKCASGSPRLGFRFGPTNGSGGYRINPKETRKAYTSLTDNKAP